MVSIFSILDTSFSFLKPEDNLKFFKIKITAKLKLTLGLARLSKIFHIICLFKNQSKNGNGTSLTQPQKWELNKLNPANFDLTLAKLSTNLFFLSTFCSGVNKKLAK